MWLGRARSRITSLLHKSNGDKDDMTIVIFVECGVTRQKTGESLAKWGKVVLAENGTNVVSNFNLLF